MSVVAIRTGLLTKIAAIGVALVVASRNSPRGWLSRSSGVDGARPDLAILTREGASRGPGETRAADARAARGRTSRGASENPGLQHSFRAQARVSSGMGRRLAGRLFPGPEPLDDGGRAKSD